MSPFLQFFAGSVVLYFYLCSSTGRVRAGTVTSHLTKPILDTKERFEPLKEQKSNEAE